MLAAAGITRVGETAATFDREADATAMGAYHSSGGGSSASAMMSAHGGLSGSKYDVKVARPLGRQGTSLAASVSAMVQQAKETSRGAKTSRYESLAGLAESPTRSDPVPLPLPAGAAAEADAAYKTEPAPGFELLDRDHVATLRTVFEMLDTDMDGRLDDSQLRTAVTAVGIPPTRRFLSEIHQQQRVRDEASELDAPRMRGGLRGAGGAGDGVAFITFMRAIEDKLITAPVSLSSLDELFGSYHDPDRDPKDHVTSFHMHHVLSGIKTSHHTELDPEEVEEVLEEFGIDYADPIDYKAFVRALSSGFVQFAD